MSDHLSAKQLNGYIHQALTDATQAAIDAHLASCQFCRGQLAAHTALQQRLRYDLLGELNSVHPPLTLTFASTIDRRRRTPNLTWVWRQSMRVVAGLTALAVVVLVAASLIYAARQTPASSVSSSPAPRVVFTNGYAGGWYAYNGNGADVTDYEVGLDSAVSHSGQASVYISSTQINPRGFGSIAQSIQPDRYLGQRLHLSGYLKTAGVTGRAGLWMNVAGTQDLLTSDDMTVNRPISGTTDWQKYDIVLDVPPDGVDITFGAQLTGSGQVWVDDIQLEIVGSDVTTTALIAAATTLTTQNPPTPTLMASHETISATSPISPPRPPICPDLPRPAMLFQAQDGAGYILRHAASKSECAMQFDPAIGRVLALTASGLYYSTDVTSTGFTKQQIIHYANDGTLMRLPIFDADNLDHYFVISPSGSRVAWSQLRMARITEDNDKIFVSELYSANADGSKVQLLHSVDNTAEVKQGAPYMAWMIRPLRFVDDDTLLFTIQPDSKGGAWNAYTGQYSNLYEVSMSNGNIILVYECPADDYSDCIGDISADNAYFAVTERKVGKVAVLQLDGTVVATYSGPGQGFIGHPTFSPTGDLVFMSADVAEDQITIEQAYISFVAKPYKNAVITLVKEPLSFIWGWVDDQHILYTAVGGKQLQEPRLSIVGLDGNVERLPKTYGSFQGVLPK